MEESDTSRHFLRQWIDADVAAGRTGGKGTYHEFSLKLGSAPAQPGEETGADALATGKYVLSESSYAEAATHKMNIVIAIDAEARTLHTYSMAGDEKGTGTYTYDEAGNCIKKVYESRGETYVTLSEYDENGNLLKTETEEYVIEFSGYRLYYNPYPVMIDELNQFIGK
jgi:hypothetical protein